MTATKAYISVLCGAVLGAQALTFSSVAQTPQSDTTRPGSTATRETHDGYDDTTRGKDKAGSATKAVTAQSFATQAAAIDKAEIELAQLALKNSKDEEIRKYAQRMVKDHSATSAKLKAIAAKQNITLPQTLDAEHQTVKQKLSSLQGEAFDREYRKEMEKGHINALALFESASQTPQVSGDLKEFAAATLPALREHQDMAHELDEDGA